MGDHRPCASTSPELNRRALFRAVLFDRQIPGPMIVCADDERIPGAVTTPRLVEHDGYSRAEFRSSPSAASRPSKPNAVGSEPARAMSRTAATWKHVRSDGTLLDLAIYCALGLWRPGPRCCWR